MKKLFLAAAASVLCAQLCASPGSRPFALHPIADGIIFGAAASFAAAALITEKNADFPEWTERSYDLDSVNYIDRKLSRKYSRSLDNLGTVTCAVNLLLPAAIYGAGYFKDALSSQDVLTLATMYAEAYLLDYGAKNFFKMGIRRVRPYMYYEGFPEDELDSHDFEFSMPSGHTTDSFLGAGFLTYTFCRYFPDSKWKIPVIAASYSVAVGTAVLRISSGNHFLTDTIFGAALGTVCGIGVPLIHEFIASRSEKKEETALRRGDVKFIVTPVSFTMRFVL